MSAETQVMSTEQVANRLVELCRMGQYQQAQTELFHDQATSTEQAGSPMEGTVTGRDAIIEKGKGFMSRVQEVHGGMTSDPIVAGSHFSVASTMDATYTDGTRMNMEEIGVYKVEDGKVVSEQFFYQM